MCGFAHIESDCCRLRKQQISDDDFFGGADPGNEAPLIRENIALVKHTPGHIDRCLARLVIHVHVHIHTSSLLSRAVCRRCVSALARARVCVFLKRDARLEHENATFVFKGLENVQSHACKSQRCWSFELFLLLKTPRNNCLCLQRCNIYTRISF